MQLPQQFDVQQWDGIVSLFFDMQNWLGQQNIPTFLSFRNTEMVQAVGHFLVEVYTQYSTYQNTSLSYWNFNLLLNLLYFTTNCHIFIMGNCGNAYVFTSYVCILIESILIMHNWLANLNIWSIAIVCKVAAYVLAYLGWLADN